MRKLKNNQYVDRSYYYKEKSCNNSWVYPVFKVWGEGVVLMWTFKDPEYKKSKQGLVQILLNVRCGITYR